MSKQNVGVIGDTHCPVMLDGYVDFLIDTFRDWSVNRIIHIGDLVDWAALSFHGTNPDLPAVRHERSLALEQIAELKKAFPKVDWLLGNHDVLPARQAERAGLSADMLKGYGDYWELPKTWKIHKRYTRLEIDGVLYCHGDQGPQGENAAKNQSRSNFRSTVIGHLHQCGGVAWTVNQDARIFGVSTGCGVDHETLAMAYARPYKSKPFIGCAVILEGTHPYVEPMKL